MAHGMSAIGPFWAREWFPSKEKAESAYKVMLGLRLVMMDKEGVIPASDVPAYKIVYNAIIEAFGGKKPEGQ